jgi:hypothetical protein
VFQHIGVIAGVKGMAVAQHEFYFFVRDTIVPRQP